MRLRKLGLIVAGVLGVLVTVPAVLVAAFIVVSVFTKTELEGAPARERIEAAFAVVLPEAATGVRLTENPLPEWSGTAVFAAPAEAVAAWLERGVLCFTGALSDGIAALPDPSPDWRAIAEASPVQSGACPDGFRGGAMRYAILVEKGSEPIWRVHLSAQEA